MFFAGDGMIVRMRTQCYMYHTLARPMGYTVAENRLKTMAPKQLSYHTHDRHHDHACLRSYSDKADTPDCASVMLTG